MSKSDQIENLKETLNILNDALKWLDRSYFKCSTVGIKAEYDPDEFDLFETLSSRYARVTDIIIQKVFRSIDLVELEQTGTIIDAANRAVRRGLVDSVDELRTIRDLRNAIVHEYIKDELMEIFIQILKTTPRVLKIADNIKTYCSKYIVS